MGFGVGSVLFVGIAKYVYESTYSMVVCSMLALQSMCMKAQGYDFNVGRSGGWMVPTRFEIETYNQWDERSKLQVGDTLWPFCFIKGASGNCEKGQKLIVVVLYSHGRHALAPTLIGVSPTPTISSTLALVPMVVSPTSIISYALKSICRR
eukprot:Gb_25460 [translate_table: standard]